MTVAALFCSCCHSRGGQQRAPNATSGLNKWQFTCESCPFWWSKLASGGRKSCGKVTKVLVLTRLASKSIDRPSTRHCSFFSSSIAWVRLEMVISFTAWALAMFICKHKSYHFYKAEQRRLKTGSVYKFKGRQATEITDNQVVDF